MDSWSVAETSWPNLWKGVFRSGKAGQDEDKGSPIYSSANSKGRVVQTVVIAIHSRKG